MFGASQGFGYGDVAAPTQEAPKQKKQEEKQTCVPVTVRIVQDAVAKHSQSQELLIHGSEASIVHIVGVVEALVQQTALIEFQLNDASGRMKVRHYVASNGSESSLPQLTNGAYVSVVGNIRTSPAAHISAMSMQSVVSADEVSYHMIEVAHAALKLRNPTTAASLPTSVAASDPITPAKQGFGGALGFGGADSKVSPMKVDVPLAPVAMQTPPKADVRSCVVDLLKQMQESAGDEGLSLATIISRTQASSDKVRDVLTQLVEDGDVFTTIDDDHFQMI